jgi:hypothetical protein
VYVCTCACVERCLLSCSLSWLAPCVCGWGMACVGVSGAVADDGCVWCAVRYLVKEGKADVKAKDKDSTDALMAASVRGHKEVRRPMDGYGWMASMAMQVCLCCAHTPRLACTLTSIPSSTSRDVGRVGGSGVREEGSEWRCVLTYVRTNRVRAGRQVVELLLDNGAEVNAQNADGHSALFFAYNGLNQVRGGVRVCLCVEMLPPCWCCGSVDEY